MAAQDREYFTNQILSATPMELIRMLYEAAIAAVEDATRRLASGEIWERGLAISKASDIITELRCSLKPVNGGDQYTENLSALYAYMQNLLVRAHVEQAQDKLQETARLLRSLLEGWKGALEKEQVTTVADPEASVSSAPLPFLGYSNLFSSMPAQSSGWQF